ncbi:MAG: sulfite exporter TauE/SafE family protein [Spongiibacteraceae bacterium]|nr:sulfite exporter TauE/SafE family protein [Spongiibacteraceae bacterium]
MTILGLDPTLFIFVIAIGFLASILHGAIGMAGGLVMAAFYSHFLGIKVAVPVITCVLIFSHLARGILFQKETDWASVKQVLLYGSPTIILGAIIFGYANAKIIALIFAFVLILSFPIKYWARSRGVKTDAKTLALASSVWGLLAGNVIGPGFFLAPFLQGTGMNRLAFVGTLATVTLVMNIIKMAVFGATALISGQHLLLGVAIGLVTVPGNILGKKILEKMTDKNHRQIIDILTVLLIMNFFYLAWVST